MDASMLIHQSAADLPAPIWFVQFFKVLGFALHMVPMNLWYAGMMLAVLLHLRGNEHGRRFGSRLSAQMPVIVAFGVNLGVVPLLFTQLGYYKVFYPATILMAWFWMGVIVLLIPAYYGVYAYASGLRDTGSPTAWKKAAGWVAAVFFVAIGFLFANGLSLMAHVEAWPGLWKAHSVAAAALGTALNTADASLWPRWLLMFGLALTTTAVWMLVDQAWFAGKESEAYRQWVGRFAPKLYTFGMIWFAAAGSWYVFGPGADRLREILTDGWLLHALTAVTALSPGLPWLMIWLSRNRPASRGTVSLIALAQFGVLGANAISRQVVQNGSLREFFDATAQTTDVQWSPLVAFLVVFVAGLGVIAWMIAQVAKPPAKTPPKAAG